MLLLPLNSVPHVDKLTYSKTAASNTFEHLFQQNPEYNISNEYFQTGYFPNI